LALKHNSKTCKLDEVGDNLVRVAMTQLNLSALADHRIFKLARTIAELTGGKKIQSVHLADALQYPPKLMLSWGGLRSHLDGAKG
jgi:magnesium chelatase family protein